MPSEDKNKLELLRCMDAIGQQLFFASGAHEKNEEEAVVIDSDWKKQFLDDAEETVKLLIKYPLPSLIHHLIEMMEFLIEGDPRRVFLLIGEILEESKKGYYHFEAMAADLTVSIIERYLAGEPSCEIILVRMLDTFVEAGWVQARRLTYRLEEIYR